MKTLDIKRMIDDCGGATKVAASIGVKRTAPYSWLRRNNMTTDTLMRIVVANNLSVDSYIIPKAD